MWRRLLRGKQEKKRSSEASRLSLPAPQEPNDLSLISPPRKEKSPLGDVRILDPIYNDILEEAIARENELFDSFTKSLNSRYCIKLLRDEMFLSNLTLLGTPVMRADNISLRLLAALLVLMAEKDKTGKFLGVMKTSEGEVRAYRDGNNRVSGLSITSRDLGNDCIHQIRALSRLKGKAIIYRSDDL